MKPVPHGSTARRAARIGLAALSIVVGSACAAGGDWRFVVKLGDREIGEHRFHVESQGATTRVHSEARFGIRVFGFNAFSYTHDANESWQGDCLERIESKTQQNSRAYAVTGVREDERFRVRTLKATSELPACVMSFAYWNPHIVRQRQLLNPQNGEYEEITVETKGTETVATLRGQETARRYTLVGRKARIDVWYTQDGRWIGLESTTDIGRTLRYILAD